MSPALQELFMAEIAPTIMATVPRVVTPSGTEDREELIQDTLVDACVATESLERRGQPVIPKSVAYYAIARVRSGRRCAGTGKMELMSVGALRSGEVTVYSLDAPMGAEDREDDTESLHDLLACHRPDPATEAARHLDWSAFLGLLKPAEQAVLRRTAEGYSGLEQAAQLGVTPPRITQIKRQIAATALAFWGDAVLLEAAQHPSWQHRRLV